MAQVAYLFAFLIFAGAYFYQRCLDSSDSVSEVVQTKFGAVKGRTALSRDGREFYEWWNIPYARPPIGDLRFTSPQPPEPWKGVRDATEPGNICPQFTNFEGTKDMGDVMGDEDCLVMNVHRPKLDDNALLPVMVFIHGGSVQAGAGSFYPADFFMDEDIVYVTMNYRLNVLGFITTGDDVIRGNMGLKDQSFALRWVRDNIEAFGGNPRLVTIFGESAGANCVHYHLLSPMSKGLFEKAIAQSGVAGLPWDFDALDRDLTLTKDYAALIKCDAQDSQKLLECLRTKSVKELLEAGLGQMKKNVLFFPHMDGNFFAPVAEAVDDEEAFLTDTPANIVKSGRAQRVPWMTGVLSEEGLMTSVAFIRDKGLMKAFEDNWESNILRHFGAFPTRADAAEIASKIKELYFPKNITNDDEKIEQYTKLFSDTAFVYVASNTANVQRKFSPMYLYYYSRRGGPALAELFGGIKLDKDHGISHGDDLAMQYNVPEFFGGVSVGKDSPHYQFSKDYIKLWADFARDETTMAFRGVPFRPQEKEGPLKYLEITDVPKVIDEPFGDRTTALNAMGLCSVCE